MNDFELLTEIIYLAMIHTYQWNGCWIAIISNFIDFEGTTRLLVDYLTDFKFWDAPGIIVRLVDFRQIFYVCIMISFTYDMWTVPHYEIP